MYPNTGGERVIASAELPDIVDGPAVWLTENGRLIARSNDPRIADWITEHGDAFRDYWMTTEREQS